MRLTTCLVTLVALLLACASAKPEAKPIVTIGDLLEQLCEEEMPRPAPRSLRCTINGPMRRA